jgi:hypothetical protein
MLGCILALSTLKRNLTRTKNDSDQHRKLLSLGAGRIGKRNSLQLRLAFSEHVGFTVGMWPSPLLASPRAEVEFQLNLGTQCGSSVCPFDKLR